MDNKWSDDILREEMIVLQEFFYLMKDVGYEWAYDFKSTEKDCVTCFYKKDGSWHTYYTEDGQCLDFDYGDKSIYDICLDKLKKFGNTDIGHYLVSNFKKELSKVFSEGKSK